MTRDEMVEIVRWRIDENREDPVGCALVPDRLLATDIVDALRAAGVIPAEGTVCVDAARWNRLHNSAWGAWTVANGTRNNDLSMEDVVIMEMLGYECAESDFDLDAIPAAPTGEGES